MPVVNPTYRTQVALGTETTPGTAVAPTHWIPCSAPKPKDNLKYYEDKALRGLAAETYAEYALSGASEFDLDGPFYPDQPGALLYGLLGGDARTTAPTPVTTNLVMAAAGVSAITFSAAPSGFTTGMAILIDALGANAEGNIIISGGGTTSWTLLSPTRFAHAAGVSVSGNTVHALSMANTPKTFTTYDFYAANQRYYPYGTVSEFSIKWSAETEATYTGKLVGLLSQSTSVQTAAYVQNVPPFIGWQSGVAFNGVAKVNLSDLALNFKRKVSGVYAAANTQSPIQIVATTMTVDGTATFIMYDDTEFNYFRNGVVQPLTFGLFGPAVGTAGTLGASGFLFTATEPTFTAGTIDRSKDWDTVQVSFACTYNTTDAGPGQVQLTNGVSAAY